MRRLSRYIDLYPDGIPGCCADAEELSGGIGKDPVAAIFTGCIWCNQVDADIDCLTPGSSPWKIDRCWSTHRVAAVIDQLISGRPGTGANILQTPGLGKGCTR